MINGVVEERMRVGCGSATIGMFAQQWYEHVDEVVVVDDHITGVLSEHQAGRYLGYPADRDQGQGPPIDTRAVLQRRRTPGPAGGEPISRTRSRSSTGSIPRWRGRGSRC